MDKNRYVFNYYSQKENNITKAFLNVLEHSVPKLTEKFIRTLLHFDTNTFEFKYKYQVVSGEYNLHNKEAKNFIIGISDTEEIKTIEENALSSVPDGGIFPKGKGDFNIIIESKVGKNSFLTEGQLQRHINLVRHSEDINLEFLLWDHIREFFKMFKETTTDRLTIFLIDHFENLCITNDIGTNTVDNDYWFYQFGDLEYIARQLDHTIMNEINYKVYYQNTRNNGIGYHQHYNRSKEGFAKLHVGGDVKCLILRYGSGKDDFGIKLQERVYKAYNLKDRRNKSNSIAQPNELWMHFDWIAHNQIEYRKLIELIELSYERKYKIK
ncbi:hypothetical protein BGM26_04555 [Bacillus sp. FJAT-29790]|uniref:hypothetical protein n=1 Tax=Bacillus sp. FJAT-29790 TaxID=1895002 RepID=UPI001C218728|nr:hypothetical protein [Bacillus sp. FJAT-29790]MBU8878258.1 hypothetical protein [Bacillus sp. FJAT-29790]